MAEIIVGAWLLRRLIGPRAMLDRVDQVGGMMFAAGVATAISATVGSISMLAGGVIDLSELPTFWRTWFLGDTSGALVVIPLILTWRDPRAAWLRMRNAEGLLLIGLVVSLAAIALTSNSPVLYLIFPAVIWAAFRFGPPGVALAVAITAGLTIGITAHRAGVFFSQPIDERTVSTQLYILVVALTGLFLSAAVCERERSVADAAEAKRREARASAGGAATDRTRPARFGRAGAVLERAAHTSRSEDDSRRGREPLGGPRREAEHDQRAHEAGPARDAEVHLRMGARERGRARRGLRAVRVVTRRRSRPRGRGRGARKLPSALSHLPDPALRDRAGGPDERRQARRRVARRVFA